MTDTPVSLIMFGTISVTGLATMLITDWLAVKGKQYLEPWLTVGYLTGTVLWVLMYLFIKLGAR